MEQIRSAFHSISSAIGPYLNWVLFLMQIERLCNYVSLIQKSNYAVSVNIIYEHVCFR